MAYKFRGGIHPPTFKTGASDRPIKRVFIPRKVVLPVSQHVGSPAEPVVKAGDFVKAGDLIAQPSGYFSSAIHASLTGTVTKIAYSPTHNQARVLSITIESQESDAQDFKINPNPAVNALSAADLLAIIKDAGIVGLGGAAFPTHVKLSPPKTKPVDAVILNGAECEPYLACDHRLMVERPKELLKALGVITKILGAKEAYIAIEDNKLSAIYAIGQAIKAGIVPGMPRPKIVVLKTKYPQGAEKQVVRAVTGRVVPAGALPMDVGCVVQSVGTAFAIYEAVYSGKPLIERVITIAGPCVREPVNIRVRIGTLVSDLTAVCGAFTKDARKVIVGGPMMGVAQYTMDIPVSKGVSGIIFVSKDEIDTSPEGVCIRCGRCLDACPMGLAPTTLMYRVKKEDFSGAKDLGIANCYECASCAYACPAKIPLLDYMKYGKSKIPAGR